MDLSIESHELVTPKDSSSPYKLEAEKKFPSNYHHIAMIVLAVVLGIIAATAVYAGLQYCQTLPKILTHPACTLALLLGSCLSGIAITSLIVHVAYVQHHQSIKIKIKDLPPVTPQAASYPPAPMYYPQAPYPFSYQPPMPPGTSPYMYPWYPPHPTAASTSRAAV